ncbi:hypothetical protein ACQPZJ_09765 [Actinoplanes sp. CA-054009]
MPEETTTPAEQPAVLLGRFEKITAVVLIALFVLFIVVMILLRDSEQWDRLVFLFGGFEALVFAAAGALFGTGVQRAQTAQAQETASRERDRADANEATARHGETLADMVRVKSESAAAEGRGARPGAGPAGGDAAALSELRRMADEWFPRAR